MDISAYTSVSHLLKSTSSLTEKSPTQHSSPVMGETLVLDPSLDAYQQASQAFQLLGYDAVNSPFREEAISEDINKVNAQVRSMMMASKLSADRYTYIAEPAEDGRPHIVGLHSMIGNIHSGYQKQYANIVKSATTYMQDINTGLGKLSNHIIAGSEGKIQYNKRNLLDELNRHFGKYSTYSDRRNYNDNNQISGFYGKWSPNDSSTKPIASLKYSEAELKFWDKKLGGQGFFVKKEGNSINIYPDLKPLREIFSVANEVETEWWGGDIMVQQFQSIQTAIDAQKNTVNSSVSRLLETFRQDNSHFETLVQLLIQLMKDLNQHNIGLINI
ncbi:TPA: IpaD/SipD/SspD family type III secretion system needle tip protein [Providencia alcalifaciens]